METELRMHEEGPQLNIEPNALKATLKKISNLKTPRFDNIHEFLFKKFTSIHDRFDNELNKWIHKTEIFK